MPSANPYIHHWVQDNMSTLQVVQHMRDKLFYFLFLIFHPKYVLVIGGFAVIIVYKFGIFCFDVAPCMGCYGEHLPVQNNVPEHLIRGKIDRFLFHLYSSSFAKSTHSADAPVNIVFRFWSIRFRVLTLSYQLFGIVKTTPTCAKDI